MPSGNLDYRTPWSGIRPEDIENGADFQKVRQEVINVICGKVLVGQSIKYDLDALKTRGHPIKDIRDTALCPSFRAGLESRDMKTPSLKWLGKPVFKRRSDFALRPEPDLRPGKMPNIWPDPDLW